MMKEIYFQYSHNNLLHARSSALVYKIICTLFWKRKISNIIYLIENVLSSVTTRTTFRVLLNRFVDERRAFRKSIKGQRRDTPRRTPPHVQVHIECVKATKIHCLSRQGHSLERRRSSKNIDDADVFVRRESASALQNRRSCQLLDSRRQLTLKRG